MEGYTNPASATKGPDYSIRHNCSPEDVIPVVLDGVKVGQRVVRELLPYRRAVTSFAGPKEIAALDRLEREHDNLRAALAWSGAEGEGEAGLRLATALARFWQARGYLGEGREHLAGMLTLQGAEVRTAVRARALHRAGMLASDQGEYEAGRALFEESLAICRELENNQSTAWSLRGLGDVAHRQGEYGEARALLEESLAIWRKLGNKPNIAENLEGLAAVAVAQAKPERAARLFGAAEGLRDAMGAPLSPADRAEHDRSVAVARAALGEAAFAAAWAEGRVMPPAEAVEYALEAAPQGIGRSPGGADAPAQ